MYSPRPSIPKPRLIVFDWDGTLIDSEAHIVASLRAAAEAAGMPERNHEEFRDVIGLGLREALRVLYPDAESALLGSLADNYRRRFFATGPSPSSPFPGARRTLEWVSAQGYLLAVATGKARRGLDRSFSETGFGGFFHASRCADEAGSKPHPGMLREIMAQLDVPAEQTLMVGDTEYDLEMAHRAGVPGIAVSYGVHSCERMSRWQPLSCLGRIEDLASWLQGDQGAAASSGSPAVAA